MAVVLVVGGTTCACDDCAKLIEVVRQETSRGSVFLVLDGSSIPMAIGRLLF